MLNDILEKKHDKVTCKANCIKNGKIFCQTPYQCQYYSGDLNYDNLLTLEKYNYDPTNGATTSLKTDPHILKFFVEFVHWEDLKSDLEIGVRQQKDVVEHEHQLGEL